MARLRAYPRERATKPGDDVRPITVSDWRTAPAPDDRPTVTATERMWWRSDGRLAYPAGAQVPEEEMPELIGDTEHQAAMRGHTAPAKERRRR